MRLLYQITNGARDMSFGELESRQARGELLGKLGELVHGATSLEDSLFRLARHLLNGLHGLRHVLGSAHLLLGRVRDAGGEVGGAARDLGDRLEALARLHGHPVARLHFLRPLLHDHHGFLGVRLDVLDEDGDVLRRLGRALRELAHLVGDHGKAQPRLTRSRGLDGGVEGHEVGLGGDVLDGVDDLRDLHGAIAQALDLLRDGLHLAPDPLHALQAVAHRRVAALGGVESFPGGRRRGLGALRHLPHELGQGRDGRGHRAASRAWSWTPWAMRPVEPLIWLALTDTCMAATRTSAMMAAISATMRLMASTTLPRTSEVTSPRLVRSPWETSMAVSRNLMMFS